MVGYFILSISITLLITRIMIRRESVEIVKWFTEEEKRTRQTIEEALEMLADKFKK